MKHYGNISKIKLTEADCVDVVVGGSPCQNLSVAGNRAGLEGEQSKLFLEQIRIIKEMRALSERSGRSGIDVQCRYAVWENVPGALSSNGGEDFRRVIEEFCRVKEENVHIPKPSNGWNTAGCVMGNDWSVAWRVMDAQFWGVPQRRRRISLVADFAGRTAPEICFKPEGLRWHPEQGEKTRQGTAGNAQDGLDGCG